MAKTPLTPPVSEADAPDYAANLRRATLASTLGTTFITPETQGRDLTRIQDALVDTRAGVVVER
jgi:hypothetical protein